MTAYARRTYGEIPDNLYVLWHNRKVLKAVFKLEQTFAKCDALDPHLKTYAQLASAGVIGCSWCLDFGYYLAHNDGLDEAKVREVPRWRESDVFDDTERAVLEYAEAMSTTPLGVTDEMVARLNELLGHAAVVELTHDGRHRERALALQRARWAWRARATPTCASCRWPSPVGPAPYPPRHERRGQATDVFVAHRNLLFTVAYEMLGSAADAEDVLQETWLRWAEVDRADVRDERAYLVRITTRLSLNRMRTMARRRESYVGPWLPEPLLTTPDVAEDVELADSVSMAMLLVLETLNPTERAVFVLREVFDFGYDEIAAAVDKTPAAVRQIAHRARDHVDERRPRGDVTPSPARRGDRQVPRGDGDRRPADPARRAGAGRGADHRRRRREAGRAAPDPRPRQGEPLAGRRAARRAWRPTSSSSTAPRRSASSSTASSTASARCWSRTAWSPASTGCATRRSWPGWTRWSR